MIKIDLITGFLGAGKTTLLLRYAKYLMAQGLRIGILEYDYGAVNIDTMLLSGLRGDRCELEMLAAACDADCLKRRFRTKLISMAMSGYDRVLVEPSGIFDTDDFFDALRDEPLDRWYEAGSVLTVVDACLREDMDNYENFLLASQAANAGCLVLSRVQLADAGQIARTKAHLQRAGEAIRLRRDLAQAQYLEKDWDSLTDADYALLANCGWHPADYVKKYAGQSGAEFTSLYFLDKTFTEAQLRAALPCLFADDACGTVRRVKGCFAQDGQWYRINAVNGNFVPEKTENGQPALIVIGNGLKKDIIEKILEGGE